MRRFLSKFVSNESGNVATIGVICFGLTFSAAGLGIDFGKVYADKRKLQSAADLAAIVAASDVQHAQAAAQATAVKNGYAASSVTVVEPGVYTPTATLAPQNRFVLASADKANAVRVSLKTQTTLMFAKLLTGHDQYELHADATATTTGLATFAIGSRLVSLNGGLLNAILSGMLGTTVSLSAMDYQALLDAKVDAFDFINALALRAGVTAGTYSDLLSTNLKTSDVLGAIQDSISGSAAAKAAAGAIARAATGRVVPSTVLDAGPYGYLAVGTKPRTSVSLSALDLISASARAGTDDHQLTASIGQELPGIASLTVKVTIGEMPQGRSWVAVGSQGATVHTAQTRVFLNLKISALALADINLPLYVEVAAGTATLSRINCAYTPTQTSSVDLSVRPGIVDAWIGAVTDSQMRDFSRAPNPGPATIVQTPVLRVNGLAHATMANTADTTVTFDQAAINAQTKKTVNTTSFTSSLTMSLLDDLRLDVSGIALPGVLPSIRSVLSTFTGPIDAALNAVLAAMGIGVGQVDVWVAGLRCDGAVLVN